MANPIETIVQAYVATVTSQQQPSDERNFDISAPQLVSSSSSDDSNNNLNSRQPTSQSYSNRSFFRRAWDTVESIFVQKDANLPVYFNNYEREEEEDDTTDEFIHPNPYQQPLSRAAVFGMPVHKRRLSQHSQELISVSPSDYSPRSSSSEWPTRLRYEDWQRDQGEPDIEEANVKDLIAGWAMGEGRPWFD